MPAFYRYLAGLALALVSGAGPVLAQTLPSPGPRTCATPQATALQQAQLTRRVPGYRAVLAASHGPARPQGTAAVTYTLPVVVHIINDGEAVGTGTNISQAQVQSQLDVLNEDYRKLNADGQLVPSAFQPLRADAQVQFRLAGIDPNGQPLPEPGIDRVNRNARGWNAPPYGNSSDLSYIEGTIKPQTSWNPDNYVNIWVMSLGGNLLGYAQLPDNTANLGGLFPQGGLATTDGVVIRYSAFGRTGTLATNYDKGRTATHEVGHFLGLRHVWGDDNCGDDYVADTPTQQTSNFGCPTFPHVTCSNGPTGDMFMNFLDYVNDGCMGLFSAGQADRMQAVLAAGTPRRSSLPTSPALCQPLAAGATNSGPACAGTTASLSATTVAGATYSWRGPNGFASTQQNPVLPNVSVAAAGAYTVTITSASGGTCPGSATTTLAVGPPPAIPVLTATQLLVCPGTPVTLSALNYPAAAPPGTTYTWSLVRGDGLPAAVSTPALTVVPTQAATYRLTVSTGGCAASDTIHIYLASPIWTGATGNGSWFDAANWDSGCVPNRSTNATIPAGLATPYPTIGSGTAEVHTLTQWGDLVMTGGELALYGDYLRVGSFTASGGTVATRGAGSQFITCSTFQNLTIGGSGTKDLLGISGRNLISPSVAQLLTMAGGILNTPITLTLAPDASLVNETDASYVLGLLQTTHVVGTTTDTFGGLGASITAASAPGSLTVTRTTGEAPQGIGAGQAISRYYDIATAPGGGPQGVTLALAYLPHELNGIAENQLTLFKSTNTGTTWTNEGATTRDAAARQVTRTYANLPGRWALAGATPNLAVAAVIYSIQAFPIPFTSGGLSLQISTPAAGPLSVQLYDAAGRRVIDRAVASIEAGVSTVTLPGSEQLAPGLYFVRVQQAHLNVTLKVVRQ